MSEPKKDASGKHSVLSLLCNSFLPWTFPCSYLPLVLSELRGDFVHRYKTTVKKRRSVTCPAEPGTPTSTTLPLEKTQEVSGPVRQAVFQYADTSSPQWECMAIHNRSYLPQSTIILLVWHRISSWFFFLNSAGGARKFFSKWELFSFKYISEHPKSLGKMQISGTRFTISFSIGLNRPDKSDMFGFWNLIILNDFRFVRGNRVSRTSWHFLGWGWHLVDRQHRNNALCFRAGSAKRTRFLSVLHGFRLNSVSLGFNFLSNFCLVCLGLTSPRMRVCCWWSFKM